MRKKALDDLWSINCINVCICGYNCCQTGGIELSKCVYLASMGVQIEHINWWLFTEYDVAWGILKFQCKTWEFRATSYSVNNHQNAYLMIMSAKTLATTSQNCKNLCFSQSKMISMVVMSAETLATTSQNCKNLCFSQLKMIYMEV